MSKKILLGINPTNHSILGFDELEGLSNLGFQCKSITYGSKNLSVGNIRRILNVVRNAFKLIKGLNNFNPDILYLNSRLETIAILRDFISIILIKCFYFKKLKIVIKSHGSDPSVLYDNSFLHKYLIIPYMIRQVNAWLFLSVEEVMLIKKYSPELASKSHTTSNIIDPSRSISSLVFRNKYGISHEKFNILFVGRITLEKGVFDILNSIPYSNFKENYNYIFVGDGPDLNKMKEISEKLNLGDYVNFLGYINEKESDHFYANADILIFPTFFNEGFPMALFKSVAVGLPIITTKTRAAIDHLSTPNNVIWVEPKSEKSIAIAIDNLFKNPELRKVMSDNNKLLGENFTQKTVCKQMQTLFTSI
jgi:glycosyltransferase involved in cell wall biosynthesis